MAKITSPVAGFKGRIAGVTFKDGAAETDDPGALAYFRRKGYKVGGKQGEPSPQLAALTSQTEPADPREVSTTRVGTPIRDASVDPRPGDFLPPTNAGKANPHGPKVVAPEVHASGTQVIRPGEVYVEDLAQQQKAETEHAIALLVDGKDAADVVSVSADADRGELGLSDPGSAKVGRETDSGNAADLESGSKKAPAKKPGRRS